MPSEQQKSTTPPSERDEWRTPKPIFHYANMRWGPLEIDLAASAENTLCPRFFTQEDDALSKRWHEHGASGWCNPPYSNTGAWVEKAAVEAVCGFTTVMLLPEPAGASWMARFSHARNLVFLIGRVSFLRPDGKTKVSGNRWGSIIAVFGPRRPGSRRDRPPVVEFTHRKTLEERYYALQRETA